MKYPAIPVQLFEDNRARFKTELRPGSAAIFTSNYEYMRNGDALLPFRQQGDLFWLCGVGQEETILVIFPDCPVEEFRECLFIKETNDEIAIWNGHKLSKDEARKATGIKNIFWFHDFWPKMRAIINMAENIYLPLNENDRYAPLSPYKALDFANELKDKFPLHQYYRAAPIMQRLRSLKNSHELELMRHAVGISKKGFQRLLSFVKPNVWEYEVEAELIHEYLLNRATGHSFHPIIASGASACVLHYEENNKQCKNGDLLLIDCGVDYAYYASDMTRTIPVNGRFSPRQKAVYNAVLRVMKGAREMLKPGTMLMEYHKNVGTLMEKELVDLGLLTLSDIKNQNTEWPAYKKYFMHGTSHFLGIDVHDSGMRYEPMKAGMVFSCEPGIYIREEGIGIRIEN